MTLHRLAILSWITVMMMACTQEQKVIVEERIRPVVVQKVVKGHQKFHRNFSGKVQSRVRSTMSFQVGGTLEYLPIVVGQTLEAKTLMAKLNDSDLILKLQQEQARLAQIKVDADNAKSQFGRSQQLFKKRLVSANEFEQKKAAFASAQAAVNQAEKVVEISQKQLEYAELRSPLQGCRVIELFAEQGELIKAGAPLVSLSCGRSLEVSVSVPESMVSDIHLDDRAAVHVVALNRLPLEARISEIGVDSAGTFAYPVTLELTSTDPRLLPGMAAEVQFTLITKDNPESVWVPPAAVGQDRVSHFVYVFEPDVGDVHSKGKATRVNVDIGAITPAGLEISKGIKQGQLVITAGLSHLYEGRVVKLLKNTVDVVHSSPANRTTD